MRTVNGPIPRVEPAGRAACEVWTRPTAIARLRAALLALSDGERSMCSVAAELGVFCRGFRQWSDGEFLRRWTRVIGRSTHLTRAQMERLADLWQLSEQVRTGVCIACDLAPSETAACRGWAGFSNAYLEGCCDEILGRNIVVVETNYVETNRIAQSDHVAVFELDADVASGSTVGREVQNGAPIEENAS